MSFDPTKVKLTPIDELPKKKEEVEKKKKEKKKKPKKKLKYNKDKYAEFPPVPVINKTVVNTLNSRLRSKPRKMELTDTEIGEASIYLLEYYAELDTEHPVLIFMGAVMGTGLKFLELTNQPDVVTN